MTVERASSARKESDVEKSTETRLQHLNNLEKVGINCYPPEPPLITHRNEEIANDVDLLANTIVSIGGRIMAIRDHGKRVFYDVADHTGSIQVMLEKKSDKPDAKFDLIKENYDEGDWVNAQGLAMRTRTGQATVKADELVMLVKATRSIPKTWGGITDPEVARRVREVELVTSPERREVFRRRARMVQLMREQFLAWGYLEVETPVLDTTYGGALAKPFTTHHEALGEGMFLRISPELPLKRLTVGHMGPVFEFSRNFRNEGMDRTHNPEFTTVEAYVPYADYNTMMKLMETMFENILIQMDGTTIVKYNGNEIDFKAPWRRITIYDILRNAYAIDPSNISFAELLKLATREGISAKHLKRRGDMLLGLAEYYADKPGNQFIQPTFILDYPRETSPLTKAHRRDPELVERFECAVGGLEVANSYSELNDPRIQRQNFEEEDQRRQEGNQEAMPYDENFLRSVEYGLPLQGGIGISIDRMAMILTETGNIMDIILFPQTRRLSKQAAQI